MSTDHAQPTLARLAATTPARDWSRLRLTGRLDWRAVIAEADLPRPLADLVTRVVARSRLWRIEKADLARELAAHFADGLRAGHSSEELAMDFGDPRKAARLMRRAERRARPFPVRAFIHTVEGVGAILLAGAFIYALLAWRYYSGGPTITRNFTAEYNERVEQIPEGDRAWDLYVEAYVRAERPPRALEPSWPAVAPEHRLYGEALAYLDSQKAVIDILRRAAARPHLGAPLSDAMDPRIREADERRDGQADGPRPAPTANPMLVSILLPELGRLRGMARLLTFDAHVAARAGEADRAARDIATMLGIGQHAAERPLLISSLVGHAIQVLAIQTTAEIVNEHPDLLTDEQIRELAHRHAAFMGGRPHVDLTGERWFFEDIVQRIYTDDGNGNGHITAEGMRQLMGLTSGAGGSELEVLPGPLGPITAAVIADRASMTAMHDKFMTQMERNAELPMWEYDSLALADGDLELLLDQPINRVRYFPIAILMPALEKASRAAERATQQRDALLTGLALELYRRDHGVYPDALEALVPAYLPAVPPDRFTGDPLNYTLADGRPRLWSVGVDRDDDGGRKPAGARDLSMHWMPGPPVTTGTGADNYDGDWILWPIRYAPLKHDPGEEPVPTPGGAGG